MALRPDVDGQHQPGEPAATPQVADQLAWGRRVRGGGGEATSVLDLVVERTGPQETVGDALLEDLGEGDSQAGWTTTWRRGSSPSEVVVTPSMLFTMSCTILRSAELIGSRAIGTPAATTSSATSGDVEEEPAGPSPGPPLDDGAGQVLEGEEGGSLMPDQQPGLVGRDLQLRRVLGEHDHGRGGLLHPQDGQESVQELLRHRRLLRHGHLDRVL